ncbi:MAG: hypothetical protein ABL949_12380 [Fimbriimonadaceae bacterium]
MNMQHTTQVTIAIAATLFGSKLVMDECKATQSPPPKPTSGRSDVLEATKRSIEAELRLESQRLDVARGLLKQGNITATASTLSSYLAQFPIGYLRKQAFLILADAELRRDGFANASAALDSSDHSDSDVRAMTGLVRAIRGQLPVSERGGYKDLLCDLEMDEIRPFLPNSESHDSMLAGWYLLVGRELGSGNFQGSTFYLEQALRLCPDNPAVLICLSDTNWVEGVRTRSLGYMRRAVPQLSGELKRLYSSQLREREYIVSQEGH